MSYDAAFFAENRRVATVAAEVVMPWVLERTGARYLIDVGCSQGAWLSVAKTYGCTVHGVDGFVPDGELMVYPDEFDRRDLTGGFDCSGYDLALCLEVGEHLPEASASLLVAGLCGAPVVLFSAATPGQGGEGHINEQPHEWWDALFAQHGYHGSDEVRRAFTGDERVASFYQWNLTLYRP